MSYAVIVSHTGELYHHGIKGQKWGVVNGPPYPLGRDQMSSRERASATKLQKKAREYGGRFANVRDYGWKRGHAMNVANRMHYNIRKNSERMRIMSDSQKKSLENAEKYWNARAKGEKTESRNLIKRSSDDWRSRTATERYVIRSINNIGNLAVSEIPGGALAAPVQSVLDMAFEELVYNIIFGHF